MNFASMEYFATLARERNFTRAAEQLHITQQSLSSHIAGLEKELDCQLLVRHVPLELTYAGEIFLRYALSFQKEHTAMLREFSDISHNQKGVLKIGTALTRGRVVLPEIIRRFQEIYPNIEIELMEAANDALHRRLLNGEIDLAIANFPNTLQDIVLRDFYCEEVVLLISDGLFRQIYGAEFRRCEQRLAAGDFSLLQACPFVLRNIDDTTRRIGHALFKNAGIARPVVKAKSSSLETLLALCSIGVGACFCPENLAKAALSAEQINSLKLFRLGGGAKYQVRFGYLAQSYQWSIIEAFMEQAEAAFLLRENSGARYRHGGESAGSDGIFSLSLL